MAVLPNTLNLNNLTVDPKTGHVSFSGLGSGIDWQSAIQGIIAARQAPIDTLNQKISDNQAKISALQDLRTKVTTLKNALSTLKGTVTVDSSSNVFAAKQTFATAARTDGLTASAPGSLIGVTASNAAEAGIHTLEVRRVATAHKLGSTVVADKTADLGYAGSFDITGKNTKTITVSATDSLADIRDRINSANTGVNATGVSASIVQISATEYMLVLTNSSTGQDIVLDNETGGVLNSLGISADGGATFLNELQIAQTARFTVDGLKDADRFESEFVSSTSAQLGSIASSATFPGSFDINVGGDSVTVNYTSTDTISTLATKINDAITLAGGGNAVFDQGVSASVVADGNGYRLVISNPNNAAITFDDTNGLVDGLGLNNDLIIERSSNTVTDVFPGLTLTLFQAEQGTTITLEVAQDQAAIESAVTGFVDSYNDLRKFINEQSLTDPTTGQKSDSAGPLFGSSTLATIKQTLSQILGAGVGGASEDFSVLAQIGIKFVDNSSVADPTENDTLTVDTPTLETALQNNPDDLKRLFAFDFTSSDPRVTLLSFTGNTAYSGTGYTLNLTHDGTNLTGVDFNGVGSSATFNGNILTATSATGANGLKLLYNGTGDANNIQIDFTVGLGAQMSFALDNFLDTTTGTIQADIQGLDDQNTHNSDRIDSLQALLDSQTKTLTQKFINMETALAQAANLQTTLTSMFNAATKSGN